MSKKEVLACDACEENLIINTSYPANYSLELNVIDTNRNTTGVVYAVNIIPPFNETKHFCNLRCLANWVKEN